MSLVRRSYRCGNLHIVVTSSCTDSSNRDINLETRRIRHWGWKPERERAMSVRRWVEITTGVRMEARTDVFLLQPQRVPVETVIG